MKINTKNYAIALYEVIKETKGEQQKAALRNFIVLLAQKNILSLAPKILDDFSRYYNSAEEITEIEIQTAKELSGSEQEKIKVQLKKIIGQEIDLKSQINPDLIGGLRLKLGDDLIDGSLQTQVMALRKQILSNN
ncbi:MAG: ATP synthase F1 subunit delta [Candidatus Buchananbacteria bacterium]